MFTVRSIIPLVSINQFGYEVVQVQVELNLKTEVTVKHFDSTIHFAIVKGRLITFCALLLSGCMGMEHSMKLSKSQGEELSIEVNRMVSTPDPPASISHAQPDSRKGLASCGSAIASH